MGRFSVQNRLSSAATLKSASPTLGTHNCVTQQSRGGARVKFALLTLLMVLVGRVAIAQTYCTPLATDAAGYDARSNYGDYISSFSFSGSGGTSISFSGNTVATSAYVNQTGAPGAAMIAPGGSYSASIASGFRMMNCQVYIDFNNDGTFQSSETVGGANGYNSTTFTVTIPSGISTGIRRMRVRTDDDGHGSTYPSIDPCADVSFGMAVDFNINVVTPNIAPVFTNTSPQSLTLCENLVATDFSSLLQITDADAGQTETWSVTGSPAHGNIATGTTATSGGTVAPTGFTYTPNSNYSGPDAFTIQASDGAGGTASATINVTVNATPTVASITGTPTVVAGLTTELSDAAADGTWNTSASGFADVNSSGLVSGVSAGSVVISYTVTSGGCSTTVTTNVTVNAPPSWAISGLSTSAGAAYSLRKVNSGYTGNAITVRRSGDNTTMNIGFDANGYLDTAILKTFCGSGDGFVTTWYDQSGNGNDLVQTTNASQPGIVAAGTIYRSQGLPAIYNNVGQLMSNSGTWLVTGSADRTLNAVLKRDQDATPGGDFSIMAVWSGLHDENLNEAFGLDDNSSSLADPYTYGSGDNYSPAVAKGIAVVLTGIRSSATGTSTSYGYLDGAGVGTNSTPVNTVDASYGFGIGQRPDNHECIGYYSEIFYFPSALSTAQRNILECDQNTTYSIVSGSTTGTPSVCAGGGSATLTNSVAGGAWATTSSIVTLDNTGNTTVTITGVSAGTANVTYTANCASAITTVTVNALPTATISYTGTPYCASGTATVSLSGTTGGAYSSTTGLNIDGTTGALNLSISTAGTYMITYTMTDGVCTNTATTNVAVNAQPVMSVTPTSAAICEGGNTVVTATATLPATTVLLSQNFNAVTDGLAGQVGGTWTVTNAGTDPTGSFNWSVVSSATDISGDGTPFAFAIPGEEAAPRITITTLSSPAFSTSGYSAATLSLNAYIQTYAHFDHQAEIDYSTDGGLTWNQVYNLLNDATIGTATWAANTPTLSVPLPDGALNQPNVMLRWYYYSVFGGQWAVDNITLSASNFQLPASDFTWSGPAGSSCASGCYTSTLSPASDGVNTYTVAATYAGCTATSNINVTVNPNPSVTLVPGNISCNNSNGDPIHNHGDGTVALTVTNGATPFNYSWSGGEGHYSASPAGLTQAIAATYSLTLTDANRCVATGSAIVGQPDAVSVTLTPTNISCNNSNGDPLHNHSDGSIATSVTGGAGSYIYTWFNGISTPTINGLIATASYSVTVTDNNGCTTTGSATVDQPDAITYASVTATNISCNNTNGGTHNDGTATVNGPTGGTNTLTYLWSDPSGQTTSVATGLTGTTTYTVTITDGNSCTATGTATVNQPVTISYASVTATNISCNNTNSGTHNDGTATVNGPTGGTNTLTYLWSDPTGQTTSEATGLTGPATYSVTITDGNSCTATGFATVNQPVVISYASVTATGIICNNNNGGVHNNGTATVNGPTGGTPGYTYAWSNGEATNPATGLTGPATYSVTISDANGCTTTGAATVSQSAEITLSAILDNVSCNGGYNGYINADASGGTWPYFYTWNSGGAAIPLYDELFFAPAGTYSVTATDLHGCSVTAGYTITQPDPLALSATTADVSCHGGSNGSINTIVTGGTAPYIYNWSGGAHGANPGGLSAGIYYLTVIDAHGCSISGFYVINQPAALGISATTANASCNRGSNGSINTTVTGGTSGYNYSWSNGSVAADPTGLAAATYTVVVTDANSCSVSHTYTISQPTAISIAATTTNVGCNGGSNGSINTTVTGGTPGYSYVWSNGLHLADPTGLVFGTYSVTVTDAHSCTAMAAYTVTQPAALGVSGTVSGVSCYGGSNGSITTGVTGGTPAYTYSWSAGGGSSANLTGKVAGTYSVTVTDAHGCIAKGAYTITQPSAALSVSGTVTNASCYGEANGSVATSVAGGTPSYSYAWSPSGGSASSLSGKSAGTYIVTVTDARGCTAAHSFTITQPAALSCAITVTPGTSVYTGGIPTNIYLGYGPQSITLNATATGGSGFTYLWSSASGTSNLSNIHVANPVFTASLPGHYTYVVTITNSNGCSTTCSVSICVIDAVDHSHSGHILLCHAYGCSPVTISCTSAEVATHFPSHCPSDHLGPVGSTCTTSGRESGDDENTVVINDLTVNAFPNPFNSEVHLKIQSNLMDNVDVTVYDVTGRVKYTISDQAVESEIVLGQNFAPGVYVVEVIQGGQSKKVKVVKY